MPKLGYKRTVEHTLNHAKSMKGVLAGCKNPNFGKHQSEEVKKIIGNANRGENNVLFGKHIPESTKKKMRISAKKAWQGPDAVIY